MTTAQWILVAALTGGATYAVRLAPFFLGARYALPEKAKDFLVYTSLAIVAGIISKAIFLSHQGEGPEVIWIKLTGLAVGMAVYSWKGASLPALFAGVGAATLLKVLAG